MHEVIYYLFTFILLHENSRQVKNMYVICERS